MKQSSLFLHSFNRFTVALHRFPFNTSFNNPFSLEIFKHRQNPKGKLHFFPGKRERNDRPYARIAPLHYTAPGFERLCVGYRGLMLHLTSKPTSMVVVGWLSMVSGRFSRHCSRFYRERDIAEHHRLLFVNFVNFSISNIS